MLCLARTEDLKEKEKEKEENQVGEEMNDGAHTATLVVRSAVCYKLAEES